MSEYRQMVISQEDCVACGSCAEVCPLEAIEESESGDFLVTDKCGACGMCLDVCPSGAIWSMEKREL